MVCHDSVFLTELHQRLYFKRWLLANKFRFHRLLHFSSEEELHCSVYVFVVCLLCVFLDIILCPKNLTLPTSGREQHFTTHIPYYRTFEGENVCKLSTVSESFLSFHSWSRPNITKRNHSDLPKFAILPQW